MHAVLSGTNYEEPKVLGPVPTASSSGAARTASSDGSYERPNKLEPTRTASSSDDYNMLTAHASHNKYGYGGTQVLADGNNGNNSRALSSQLQDRTLTAASGGAGNSTQGAAAPSVSSSAKQLDKKMQKDLQSWQIERSSLQLGDQLGAGFFGEVIRGRYRPSEGSGVEVAVKTFRSLEDVDEQGRSHDAFVLEAMIMIEFSHPNVLSLVGVATLEEPFYILLELAPFGDLRAVLVKCAEKGLVFRRDEHLALCGQIAVGMEYLAVRQFIHRDLAARNVLVARNGVLKIADFGMARAIVETDYYKSDNDAHVPIRWMAPESIEQKRFTIRSDIWSYGIVMWEIHSNGAKPFGSMMNELITIKISQGTRLECPEGCHTDVYEVMRQCWSLEPSNRPPFNLLKRSVRKLELFFRGDGPSLRCIGELSEDMSGADDPAMDVYTSGYNYETAVSNEALYAATTPQSPYASGAMSPYSDLSSRSAYRSVIATWRVLLF